MQKLISTILIGILTASYCLAETVECTTDYKPTLLDKIEYSTQDFAESVGDATTDAAHRTGEFIKDKSQTAANATSKVIKKGAKQTGEAVKSGAQKAGNATKTGAMKATNWSAKKIRNGAEKVIIKTEN